LPQKGAKDVQVLYERCCGLDVHKKSVTACAITPEGKEIQSDQLFIGPAV